MKRILSALRWRSPVSVRHLLSRLRHSTWYYSWPTPFVLWRDAYGGIADEGRTDAIYLWPNGLRWWFLGFALFFAFFVVVFLRSELPDSWYWYCVGVLVWTVWLYPFLVFYVLRREVLSDLWGTWPPQMDDLYSRAPTLVTRSDGFRVLLPYDKRNLRHLLREVLLPYDKQILQRLLGKFLPWGRGYRSAANDGSVQVTLERIALTEYFASKPSSAGIWYDRGFRWWLLTRCGPVVAGQVAMLGLLIVAFLCQAKEAMLSILLWTLFAAGFLWHAADAFERECRVSLEDLRLPYLSQNIYLPPQTLPQMTVRLVVAVASVNFTVTISLFELIG